MATLSRTGRLLAWRALRSRLLRRSQSRTPARFANSLQRCLLLFSSASAPRLPEQLKALLRRCLGAAEALSRRCQGSIAALLCSAFRESLRELKTPTCGQVGVFSQVGAMPPPLQLCASVPPLRSCLRLRSALASGSAPLLPHASVPLA
jgi:hypothetical protein